MCVRTYKCTFIYTYICKYRHIYVHKYIYVHLYIHISGWARATGPRKQHRSDPRVWEMCVCMREGITWVNNVRVMYVNDLCVWRVCVFHMREWFACHACEWCARDVCKWLIYVKYVRVSYAWVTCLTCVERWEAGVETQKNVRGEIGGWGRVPFNEPYAPSLSTIYDGA